MKVLSTLVVIVSLTWAAPLAAQGVSDSLPEGVNSLMLAEGRDVYVGPGICSVCHGRDAKGMRNLGNDLTDTVWVHGDGTYAAIVKTLQQGAWALNGTAMPHQKATTLTDDQVRAVAAYVWTLSRHNMTAKQ